MYAISDLSSAQVYELVSHNTPFVICILMTSAFSVHRCLCIYEEFILDVLGTFCVLVNLLDTLSLLSIITPN